MTKAQREALFKLFRRDFPSWETPRYRRNTHTNERVKVSTLPWRRFRRTIQPEFASYGAVMVPWKGMWVGIEKDGYTHT
jgi:hypothetical protein